MDVYVYDDEGYIAFIVLRHELTQHHDSSGNCRMIFVTR